MKKLINNLPQGDDLPKEFQADLTALDKLDDNMLWQIVNSCKTTVEMERYNTLLEVKSSGKLTEAERLELTALRNEADRFMLRKAQAAVLLHWRGHRVPIP